MLDLSGLGGYPPPLVPFNSQLFIDPTNSVKNTLLTSSFTSNRVLFKSDAQWRRQDFFSSGANVGRAYNVRMQDAKRRVCPKRAPRREAPRSREARTEARSAESALRAESRREAPSEIGGRGLGRGLGEPLPKKIFEILKVQWCNLEAFGSVFLFL